MLYILDQKNLTGSPLRKTYKGLDYNSIIINTSGAVVWTMQFFDSESKSWSDEIPGANSFAMIFTNSFSKFKIDVPAVAGAINIMASNKIHQFVT